MAALGGVATVDIFQEARDRVQTDINKIIQSLNNKQVELFEEINKLEKEFKDKQQQQQKELNKLHSMKTRTEEELGENSLAEIQQNIIGNLQQGIAKLSLEIETCREPDYRIEVEWGMCLNCLPSKIFESKISVIEVPQEPPADPPRGANWKKHRNRRNRARSAARDANPERPMSASVDTREYRDTRGYRGSFVNEGNSYRDSNRGFGSDRYYAERRGWHYADDGHR